VSLTWTTGDIFAAPAELALVIPVNTKGIAGAGLAKAAARYDGWLTNYKAWCKSGPKGGRKGGSIRGFMADERYWVVAATKEDWKAPSRIEWVVQCLWRLSQLTSPLAIPKLGCGKGGLDWEHQVRPQVEAHAKGAKSDWLVYE
jgi:hypothetical protein